MGFLDIQPQFYQVLLYETFEVELSNDNLPGTEQKTSEGTIPSIMLS
jgi:hypothetical protein